MEPNGVNELEETRTFYIDMHEPQEAWELIAPSIRPDDCIVAALNEHQFADYMWYDHSGTAVHVERKTWGEVLGDMDKVENQLRNHIVNNPTAKLRFLIEGMATPVMGGTGILRATNNDRVYAIGRVSAIRLGLAYAWLYQISKYIEVYQTSGYSATAIALSAMYKGDQKAEHTTMERYYKKVETMLNPQVAALMGILPGVGEKRAISLIRNRGSVYNVITAHPYELSAIDGISENLARNFLKAVGRTDV